MSLTVARINYGNMWSVWDQADLFFITTNNSLNRQNHLIMGAGIALQAKQRFPTLPAIWGKLIQSGTDYHLLISPNWQQGKKIAAFQTKRDWRQPSPLDLIKASTEALHQFAEQNPTAQIKLPLPGVGKGNLSTDLVIPVIENLPQNVEVWTMELG